MPEPVGSAVQGIFNAPNDVDPKITSVIPHTGGELKYESKQM